MSEKQPTSCAASGPPSVAALGEYVRAQACGGDRIAMRLVQRYHEQRVNSGPPAQSPGEKEENDG